MAVTIDGTNGITSPDFEPSSSTTPTNGLFLPTTNALGFATNSTERLRLDASGNLGLGVTPSAWGSFKAVELPNGVALSSYTGGVNIGAFFTNAYFNGSSYIYKNSDYATEYEQRSGQHRWYTSTTSGTAGNAISFTQAMTLDASGNLGVGTTTSVSRLTVAENSYDSAIALISAAEPTRYGAKIQNITTAGATNLAFLINQNSGGYSEKARIDSSGNLLVGVTSSPQGKFNSVATANPGSNGNNGVFINTWSGDVSKAGLYVAKYDNNSTTSQIFVQFAINNNTLGSGQINANGAGVAAFGGFSDSRLKENITALPDQLANICALKPSEFDYKDGSGHQIGFIAQEMQEVYPDVVGEGEDGMLTITGWSKTEARLVKAIQELTARLEALENK